jgi:hypothetical protein
MNYTYRSGNQKIEGDGLPSEIRRTTPNTPLSWSDTRNEKDPPTANEHAGIDCLVCK